MKHDADWFEVSFCCLRAADDQDNNDHLPAKNSDFPNLLRRTFHVTVHFIKISTATKWGNDDLKKYKNVKIFVEWKVKNVKERSELQIIFDILIQMLRVSSEHLI